MTQIRPRSRSRIRPQSRPQIRPQIRMANVDAAWLGMDDPHNLMMITAVIELDGPADWDRLTEVLGARLVQRYPRFTRRAVPSSSPWEQPVWEDDQSFDLRRHLDHVDLADGSDESLRALVSTLLSRPLDMRRPPWQFSLVDRPGAPSVVVARLHHCIADGIALARVLLALTDDAPDVAAEGVPPTPPERSVRRPGLVHRARQGTSEVLPVAGVAAGTWTPRELVALAAFGVGFVRTVLTVLFASRDPRTRLRGRLGIRKAAAWSAPLELAEVKRIGAALGATVNDVLLAATAGALRRYLLRHDGHAHDLRVFVPVDLRGDRAAPDVDGLGNSFGLVLVRLPAGEPDPLRRVAAVGRSVAELRRSHQPAAVFAVLSILGAGPSWLHTLAVRILASKTSAVVTNVPGPPEQVFLAGTRVGRVAFWVPQAASVALGVSVFSYAGQVTVGVAADAGIVADPGEITRDVEAEVAELARLCSESRSDR